MCQRRFLPTIGQIPKKTKTSFFWCETAPGFHGYNRDKFTNLMPKNSETPILIDGCLIPVIWHHLLTFYELWGLREMPSCNLCTFFSRTEKAGSALDWNYLHAYQMVLGMLGLITLKVLHLQFKCIPQKQKVIQGKESEGKSVESTALLPR